MSENINSAVFFNFAINNSPWEERGRVVVETTEKGIVYCTP